jgi:hypothetical protein
MILHKKQSPDPAANGSMYTNSQAMKTKRQLQLIKKRKATPLASSPVFSFSIRLWNTLNLKFERAFVQYETNSATTPHMNPRLKTEQSRMKRFYVST